MLRYAQALACPTIEKLLRIRLSPDLSASRTPRAGLKLAFHKHVVNCVLTCYKII
jgi:hypothetical protein